MNKFLNIRFNSSKGSGFRSIWNDYNYKIENQILSHLRIEDSLDKLYNEIGHLIDDEHYLQVILKVKFNDTSIRSITYLKTIKQVEFNDLKPYCKEFWEERKDEIEEFPINSLIYTYRIVKRSLITITEGSNN
jgi:hypothetical protein